MSPEAGDIVVRPLRADDRPQWDVLWQGYLTFYAADLPSRVTEATWRRIVDENDAIRGLGAWTGNRLVGIVHFLLHPVTWSEAPRCYLEDLFTAADARGRGVGRRLIEAVEAEARRAGADEVYLLTQRSNATARRLYDAALEATEFVKYRRRLG